MRHFLAASILLSLLLVLTPIHAGAQEPAPVQAFDISQTVVKMPLADGVSADDAIDALRSRAVQYNMKLVAHQPLSSELQARGIDSGRLEIFQFCNPEDAYRMVLHNPIFAAYMPCRIALVEEQGGQISLMMIDLDMLIDNTELPPDLKEIATRINHTLLSMMKAAAAGEF
ncbi:MAG TPA: DUF302 domain-containing protein [Phycisphaerales bacterium]|nr:DUF302 domain-containing protein [Phycisphaerales bacterium]